MLMVVDLRPISRVGQGAGAGQLSLAPSRTGTLPRSAGDLLVVGMPWLLTAHETWLDSVHQEVVAPQE